MTTTDAVRRSRGGRPRDPSRDGVIRAAILRLLGEVGYGALTMDAVAAEAGVGKATIYRRWRTKEDLVTDTVAGLRLADAEPPDTGSLETDLRQLLHSLATVITGPAGAATQALLSTVPHQPALAEAFRTGPIQAWRSAFDTVWERAAGRGEAPTARKLAGESASALLVQRWLLTGEPIDEEFVDQVLERVVLPQIGIAAASD
jgi:AcrR family transcriptional regulator